MAVGVGGRQSGRVRQSRAKRLLATPTTNDEKLPVLCSWRAAGPDLESEKLLALGAWSPGGNQEPSGLSIGAINY
jgi:hypothetical protein